METLTSGRIDKKSEGLKSDYYITRLDAGHFDKLIELQKNVMADMERNDLYVGLSPLELENVLGSNGVTVGAFAESKLIGFYAILFPGDSDDNLGKDIGVPERLTGSVAHLEGAGVHPDYRGNSLQKIMTGICLKEAMMDRQINYLCATVSPYNYPSIDHVFAFGLLIRDIRKKYGEMLRYICSRDMTREEKIISGSIVEAMSSDHDRQLILLKEGFAGFEQIRLNGTNNIRFGKTSI